MVEPRYWWILFTLSLKNRCQRSTGGQVESLGGLSDAVKYGKKCLGVGCIEQMSPE